MKANTENVSSTTSAAQRLILRILKEGALLGWLLLCIYLLLALFSYSTADPGWSSTGTHAVVHNALGPTGAWLADYFFSFFGYISYLFPLMVAYRLWRSFEERHQHNPFDALLLSIRFVGLLLVIVAGTGLMSIQTTGEVSELPFSDGGVLGIAVSEALEKALGFLGATLLLLALGLLGITIFTNLSWLRLAEGIGRWSILAYEKVWRWGSVLYSRYLQKKQEQQQVKNVLKQRQDAIIKQTRKMKDRIPPTIEKPMAKSKPSLRVDKERQVTLFDAPVTGQLPPLNLLDSVDRSNNKGFSEESLEAMSRLLELKLQDFGVSAEVVSVLPGPVVTRFELQPAAGVKVSKITGLAKDLARSMAVVSVRVVEVIPGKSVVGIEIPNEHREVVRLSEVLSSTVYDHSKSPLTLALGNDISGEPIVADLAKMPHLLVAGTTGSGKSVGINVMLLSLLYKSSPKDVRLILVDPKMLELSVYEGIPHLLTPVITDMKDASNGLRWCVGEMERRYKLMAALGVRNLAGYNRKIGDATKHGEPILDPLWRPEEEFIAGEAIPTAPPLETLPAIVVVIDEFADMMMIVGKKVEQLIARIAQKARAAGIHLLLATQRPSVDVITGLIKANVPTRIAFQVSSKVDSRTIIDQGGAEQLLGHGDMLYLPPGTSVPVRVHGAFVDDHEVHRVVNDWKKRGEPNYIDGIVDESTNSIPVPGLSTEGEGSESDGEGDALYDEAVAFVTESRKASISSVQRKLRIGYNRAARLIESMEVAGVITEAGHNGNREVIAPPPPK
ncbi:cell division protein FtsK [Candidatus Endobugula sertula]|uniref:DNA translocase FtsK n=1 Tax=Candidatus Endobugula sertula TaxID=62101 RepID=A0A1D2QTH7_9GAMM|nr:cell division protein FtsK [Candidatus Endobugula sertula]